MLLHLGALAQTDKEQVKIEFQKFSSAIKSRQYTQATSFMPDQLFVIYDKQKLVQEMKQTFESADTKVKINAVEITSFLDKVVVEGKASYIPFNFVQDFELKYINLFDATDDDESRNSTTKFIVDMLNESIPESVIGFDKKQEVFTINSTKKAVAIKQKESNSWKFLVIEPSLKNVVGNLLPPSVIQKLQL